MNHALTAPALAALALLTACAPTGDGTRADAPAAAVGTTATAASGSYIYVFAGDADHAADESDFLAVIDADPSSPTYARVIATTPIGAGGSMPHHTELEMPAGGRTLFANAHMSGRTYRFDFADPRAPRVAGTLDSVPGFRMAHSFSRLADGRVLATLQFGDGTQPGDPGGVALFTADGHLVRSASSADAAFRGASIRTYSLDVAPATDRVVTTSSPMDTTSTTADVVQLWRLSDLTLLKTIPLPSSTSDSTSRYPFEVRFFPDGRSAILNTYNCGIYYLSGLDGGAPKIEAVLALDQPRHVACGVPLLFGHWWIMPIGSTNEFVVYDVSNPRAPRRASALAGGDGFDAHWMSREPGTNRIVVSVEGKTPTVRIAHFDSTSGALTWDERFRDTPQGPLGVTFDRAEWPHGKTGRAVPHGAVFSRPRGPE